MSILLARLAEHARESPSAIALDDGTSKLTYQGLMQAVTQLADHLARYAGQVIALQADNGIDWVLADLAAVMAVKPLIPIPHFFSPEQLSFVLEHAGVDTLLCPQEPALTLDQPLPPLPTPCMLRGYRLANGQGNAHRLPAGTAKVTFTSGSTGQPKGVCLSQSHIETVAQSLIGATNAQPSDRHVCLLPLPTLLENIAGIYLPLMAGATCLVLPLAQTGLQGSSSLDVKRQLACLTESGATSAILVPQMLTSQLAAFRAGLPCPPKLRFVAVGGGRVSPTALMEARDYGLPVFEGYGLSEAASVVSLNTPASDRTGSAGKLLQHVGVRLADDGEIMLQNSPFLGYLGDRVQQGVSFATGDIGELDSDGFLHIIGRKKHIYISSFGRNISPEWIESECQAMAVVRQIAVFGDDRPFNVAVVVPMPGVPTSEIDRQIEQVNARLPDYARIRRWLIVNEPFTPDNGRLTHNGRLKREHIFSAFADALTAMY